ncbi:MAG: glycosyltransferase [Polyangiales bacterium]
MKIALVCFDTRGGVQPYLALALGLRRAGHEVRVVAPGGFSPMITARGLDARPLSGDVEAIVRASQGITEKGTLAAMRFSMEQTRTRTPTWARECLDACRGVDVITAGVGGMILGRAAAVKLGVPLVAAHVHPLGPPTDAFPGVLSPWRGTFARKLGHRLTDVALWTPFRPAMRMAHEALGVAMTAPGDDTPVLYGYSRHILPPAPEWGERHRVTGYWFLPAEDAWTPPPALEDFLATPGPTVCVGFGSMANGDPRATGAMVRRAAKRAGVRVVMLSGWGGLDAERGDDLFVADAVPHDWLYPRVRAVVHHGGAGTTGAALRAGVPAQVVPFAMDQPFWGHLVADLGVGLAPIPRRKLTEDALARSLEALVSDDARAARAAALGEKIRAEDGVGEAARAFATLA